MFVHKKEGTVIITTLTTPERTITQTGTSGLTVTGTRKGDVVDTRIEYSTIEPDEMREMVCVLLCMLDELQGEAFVTSCLARYARETGKKFMSEGNGRKLVLLRGGGE